MDFQHAFSDSRRRPGSPGATDARMHARDWAIVALITVLYAALAFWNLGDMQAVENGYETSEANEQITIDFGESEQLATMQFYSYSLQVALVPITIEISQDGTTWEVLDAETRRNAKPSYGFSSQFCWQDVNLYHTAARAVRLTVPDAGTTFFELAFCASDGRMLVPQRITSSCAGADGGALSALFDEQSLVPELSDFMNSTYFDEIYHARTAYEMLHGLPWYENTHPPLGKVIMEASIATLGMTPFAWRMPGTLAGVLMLPLIYLMGKLLFRRRSAATFATLVFALDCMHYSQTRIATIDSFTLLFILALFCLLFRYVLREQSFSEQLPLQAGTLFAAGIAMGLACATKWIGFYAAVGAAIILFVHWIRLGVNARGSRAFWVRLGKTAGICVLAFLVIPFCIYFASFAQSYTSLAEAPREFWEQQVTMLSYHVNLNDTHYFASPWYEWPLDIMPMWWFVSSDTSTASTINTMGNPLVWWAGLAAIIALASCVITLFGRTIARAIERKRLIRNQQRQAKERNAAACETPPAAAYIPLGIEGAGGVRSWPKPVPSPAHASASALPPAPLRLPFPLQTGWLILVCYLCLFVPWMLVPRLTFIYHYFACTPFLALALAYWMRCGLSARSAKVRVATKVLAIAFLVLAAAAFALFFPVISGLEVPPSYIELTQWLPKWVIWHA